MLARRLRAARAAFPAGRRSRCVREGFGTDLAYFFVNHVLVHVILVSRRRFRPPPFLVGRAMNRLARAVASQPLMLAGRRDRRCRRSLSICGSIACFTAFRSSGACTPCITPRNGWIGWRARDLHLVDIDRRARRDLRARSSSLGFSDARCPRLRGRASPSPSVFSCMPTCAFASVRLEKVVATPRYHAFHHAADVEARDKNFAFHLPVIDRLFGTQYLPDGGWPRSYGCDEDYAAPTPRKR